MGGEGWWMVRVRRAWRAGARDGHTEGTGQRGDEVVGEHGAVALADDGVARGVEAVPG